LDGQAGRCSARSVIRISHSVSSPSGIYLLNPNLSAVIFGSKILDLRAFIADPIKRDLGRSEVLRRSLGLSNRKSASFKQPVKKLENIEKKGSFA
jgi:hypothetical protein